MRFVVHVIGPLVGQRDGQPAVGSMAYVVDVVLATVTGARGSTMAGVSTSGPAISWPAGLARAPLHLRAVGACCGHRDRGARVDNGGRVYVGSRDFLAG